MREKRLARMSEKKKVGILTFHNAHNYGAVLQAYALKTKLNQLGYEAQVLNYRNKYIARLYRKVFHIDFWKRDILPSRWKKDLQRIRNVFYGLDEWKQRWSKFENFIDKYVLENADNVIPLKRHKVWSISELEKSDCDIYVLGSDQIWCRELTHGFDQAYFGQFAPNKKKISYGASVPDASIPDADKAYFEKYMHALSHISVREEKLAESLRLLTNREVTTVIDPTLLLDAEDYQPLLQKTSLVQNEYILVYYVVENENLRQVARKVAEKTGLTLVEIHSEKTPELVQSCGDGETMIYDAGPGEFLTYIRDAKIVLTNSFHGTVFSILFQKKFYSVYQKNGRIENLLGILKLEDRHIQQFSDFRMEEEIDYVQTEKRLKEYRRTSIEYLERALI